MTSRTSDFTGADGVTWTLSSGSWTHVTDVATVGTATNTIDGNRGRARSAAATTSGAHRSHHIDYTNFKFTSVSVLIYVDSVTQSNNAPTPAISLHTAGTGADSDRYEVRFGFDADGKAGSHVIKRVSGVSTTVGTTAGSGGAGTGYYGFRAIKLASSILLQTAYDTSPIVWTSSYVRSYTDSTSGLWDAVGGVALAEHYQGDPTVQTTIWYDNLAAVDIQPILATGIASTATAGTASLTPTYRFTPSGVSSTSAIGAATASAGQVTLSPSGVSSVDVLGAAIARAGQVTLSPSGISSVHGFGSPSVTNDQLTVDTEPFGVTWEETLVGVAEGHAVALRDHAILEFR